MDKFAARLRTKNNNKDFLHKHTVSCVRSSCAVRSAHTFEFSAITALCEGLIQSRHLFELT